MIYNAAPKPAPKAPSAPRELAPKPVQRAQAAVQTAVKEAPKLAEKITPPSLPTPPPPPPPVTAEKPKVQNFCLAFSVVFKGSDGCTGKLMKS